MKFNQVWTELLTPRFERLNVLHKSEDFGNTRFQKAGINILTSTPNTF